MLLPSFGRGAQHMPRRLCNGLILIFGGFLCLGFFTSPSKEYEGRVIAPVMSAAGADWLVREDREKYEQPDKVLDALRITPGMTVADIGVCYH